MAKDQAPPDEPIMPAEEVKALREQAEKDGVLVWSRERSEPATVRRDVN